MPDLYLPGATRLLVGNTAPTDGGPAKAIAHITWDKNATASNPADLVPYETLQEYFGVNPAGKAAAPHILWDPFTGRFSQFFPANSRSLSLADGAGGTRTNRAGSVVLQVEALFFPYCRVNGKVYARLADTPCLGWDKLLAWTDSWGVPHAWPNGRPEDCTRNEETWRTKAGWYPHKGVPENDHTDPLSWPAFSLTPTPPEDNMEPVDFWAYTGAGDDKDAFWYQRNAGRQVWSFKGTGETNDAYAFLRGTNAKTDTILAKLDALTAKVDALETTGLTDAQVAAIADAVSAKIVADGALAASIADVLAGRLEA